MNSESSLANNAGITNTGITTSSNLGLVIDAASDASVTLDLPVASGNGTLTLTGAGTITQGANAISAGTLDVGGTGTFVLGNTGNSITNVTDAPATTAISALTLDDGAALAIGAVTATGAIKNIRQQYRVFEYGGSSHGRNHN